MTGAEGQTDATSPDLESPGRFSAWQRLAPGTWRATTVPEGRAVVVKLARA